MCFDMLRPNKLCPKGILYTALVRVICLFEPDDLCIAHNVFKFNIDSLRQEHRLQVSMVIHNIAAQLACYRHALNGT